MKGLNFIKGISWLAQKVTFVKKVSATCVAVVDALSYFESDYSKIWKNEKNKNNHNPNDSSNIVAVGDTKKIDNETKRDKKQQSGEH